MTDNTIHDTIIIGSGPAGYTAAIYSARAGLKPLVFEGYEAGGSLMTTTDVENFPGFEFGIQGPELMENMRVQAERFGAELITDNVDRVVLDQDIKQVWVGDDVHYTKSIILATGSAPRHLGIPGELELTGRGVSTCATCDGYFFKDERVAVVGGGDSALEEALFLSQFASDVVLVHRRGEFRGSQILVDRVLDNPKITTVMNTVVDEVVSDDRGVNGIRTRNLITGDVDTMYTKAMFVAIGHDPRSGVLEKQVELDDQGHVVVEGITTKTSVPGVFACGDLVDSHYQQAITAAGSGCRAAMDAGEYLTTL